MTTAVFAVIFVLAVTSPVFFTKPSHAAHPTTLSPLKAGDRVLLVVAHPDDEIIGAGGLVVMARQAGVPVYVLVLTNGDSNRLSAALLSRRLRPAPGDFVRSGRIRQHESTEGLADLGVSPDHLFFLGFPDRALAAVLDSEVPVRSPFTHLDRAQYPGAAQGVPYTGPRLRTVTQRLLTEIRPTVIITHAPFDRHPDHQAAYRLIGPMVGEARLFTFLVHAPGFPRPLRSAPNESLLPPATLAQPAGWSWTALTLPPAVESAKQRALRAHRSQLGTPYLRLLLASFVRVNELFAVPEGSASPSE